MKLNYIKMLTMVISLGVAAWAGDAGSITGVSVLKGNDGKTYIRVSHNKSGGNFGAGGNLLGSQFFIPFDEAEPAYHVSMVSLLKDAMKDHVIHLFAESGYTTNTIISEWYPVVTRHHLQMVWE